MDKSSKVIPTCIGIIMDGNRRWARERGLPTVEGHVKGYEKIREVLEWSQELGIRELIVYGFSTENWNRSKEEVSYLMRLFERLLLEWSKEIQKNDVRVVFMGERERFSSKIQSMMQSIEEETKSAQKGTLALALSYGGRAEILEAANKCVAEGKLPMTEADLRSALWSADLSDPDLIIRPGGEKRLSNFLTWQSVYSELFFLDTYWPDFSRVDLEAVIVEFGERQRRFGA